MIANSAKTLRQRSDVAAVIMINGEVLVFQTDNPQLVPENFFEFSQIELKFTFVCKSSFHFCKGFL